MRILLWILVLLAAAVMIVIFAGFNSGNPLANPPVAPLIVNVKFFGDLKIPIVLLGLISFGIGAATFLLITIIEEVALRSRIHRLKKNIESMRKEINALRNLPLAAEILTKDIEKKEEGEK
ncbi:LapA family protein [bacterium]|nr:LapA family protein [bacterium]